MDRALAGAGGRLLGLGVVRIELSDEYRRAQAVSDAHDRGIVIELTCRIAVTPWLDVQPDVRFVPHPGGTSEIDDALVLALRVDLLF